MTFINDIYNDSQTEENFYYSIIVAKNDLRCDNKIFTLWNNIEIHGCHFTM